MHMNWLAEGMTKSKFESLSPLRSQKLISKLVFKHEQSSLTLLKIGNFALCILLLAIWHQSRKGINIARGRSPSI